ncbi:FHA domain-containing protein [Rhodoferax koreense]|uniref:FHA domain-containing protein n=1 Tax=Rhodoferax koreensis TaxID=1842727 RepID=A0A1P8K2Q1_9BURK|nr:FHA domain-containing protein [Rhodoferax koreense]APW40290.1 FHA domain-containing protein [Rhodoferax koreense]
MPKLIVSIDGVVIKEVQLTKDRTTLGRRPYNDVVIDNLAVSGEHAVVSMVGHEVQLEDLNSTNGSYINGKAARKQMLQHNDLLEIGKYKIRFINELADNGSDQSVNAGLSIPGALLPTPPATPAYGRRSSDHSAPIPLASLEAEPQNNAAIKVISGAAAGREVTLTKVVTTIGKPGIAVAAITRRPHGYVVVHVEGAQQPTLNGSAIGATPVSLKNGDVLQLAGTEMQFLQP